MTEDNYIKPVLSWAISPKGGEEVKPKVIEK